MGKLKRSAVKLRKNAIRYRISDWCRQNRDVPFDTPMLTKELGMNPDSRSHCSIIYNSIKYWRDKAIQQYQAWLRDGTIPQDADRYARWDVFLSNYNQNDAYVFLYDNTNEYFIQPGFDELERMDRQRLQRQWQGILTVIDEMVIYDNRLLVSGIQKPVAELIEAGKQVDLLLDGKSKLEKWNDKHKGYD